MSGTFPIPNVTGYAFGGRRTFGDTGEAIAAEYLKRKGYRLVMANFKVPIGRNRNDAEVTGEIDLIAIDGEALCFVEVKTRRSDEYAGPLSSIDLRKQRQITRAARVYRRIFNIQNIPFRYDAVSVMPRDGGRPRIELVKGYWSEGKFKNKLWVESR